MSGGAVELATWWTCERGYLHLTSGEFRDGVCSLFYSSGHAHSGDRQESDDG